MEQLEDNLKATDVSFTPEELKEIDRTIRPGTHAVSYTHLTLPTSDLV